MTTDTRVQERIDQMIGTGRTQAVQVLTRLQSDVIEDRIARVGPGANGSSPVIELTPAGVVTVGLGNDRFGFHHHGIGQLAEKLDLPAPWVRSSMQSGQPWRKELVADVLATYLAKTQERQRLLFRAVAGEVRGVLSDSYRRLNSSEIATAFARSITSVGAVPYAASMTDLNWSVSAMLPEALGIQLPNGDTDWVGAALHLSSSDFGSGALQESQTIIRLLCSNGMIGESALRAVHLGGRLPDDLQLSERTYALDTKTQASTIYDLSTRLLSKSRIEGQLAKVREAAKTEVDADKALGGLVRARKLTEAEAKEAGRAMMGNDPKSVPSGPATAWKLGNAVSWLAHSAGTPERAEELRRLAASAFGLG